MNLATKKDKGVSTITAMEIIQFVRIMNTSVRTIVITPVNNCEKPSNRPSAKASASAMKVKKSDIRLVEDLKNL